ncbi:MutS-related protein [Pseudoflavitalea rhizosphaerae]|uniref:MutS-related protein n=1 Tax=Pseudoflavitalea rhizosphaerae TaxID=1884793 RepID=UPI000F8C3692|nr:DNA mismatch repair protein [Pseudoflavitalea rhizosphaerae]
MNFIADTQTLEDLALLGKFNPNSVFSLFNKVKTRGAEKLLDRMFRHPMTDADSINARSQSFRYYYDNAVSLPVSGELVEKLEAYLDEARGGSYVSNLWTSMRKKVMASLVKDESYGRIEAGVQQCILFLQQSKELLQELEQLKQKEKAPWKEWADTLLSITGHSSLSDMPDGKDRLSLMQVSKLHHLFSQTVREPLQQLLELTYELDLMVTVGHVARAHNFNFAVAEEGDLAVLDVQDLRHPSLKQAVPNNIRFDTAGNTLFLTGANMAGKSTLMKSAGIAAYLAHMGFPLACSSMRFTVMDGLYSSVNVPDDLNKGYSHFYAEVLRVKTVAAEVASEKKLFVIFDELFKGTNVKDAYDATLAVTAAFASFRKSFFIISTHIIEVGEELMRSDDSIRFVFLSTVMRGTVPTYTYTLQKGITEDRQGMIILENEGILQML